MTRGDPAPRRLSRRLLWFIVLWGAGVLAVGLLAYGLRLLIL